MKFDKMSSFPLLKSPIPGHVRLFRLYFVKLFKKFGAQDCKFAGIVCGSNVYNLKMLQVRTKIKHSNIARYICVEN